MNWVKPQCTKLKKSTLVDNPEMLFGSPGFQPHLHIGYKLYIVFLFRIHSTVNKVVDNLWLLGLIHTVIICVDCVVHAAHNILPETDPRLFEVQIYSKNPIDQSTWSTATEGLWPLHFEHSHWWKRWSRSTFASHYAWDRRSRRMQDGCKSLHGFLHGIKWIMFHDHLDYLQRPSLGIRLDTKPLGDRDTSKTSQLLICSILWCVKTLRE